MERKSDGESAESLGSELLMHCRTTNAVTVYPFWLADALCPSTHSKASTHRSTANSRIVSYRFVSLRSEQQTRVGAEANGYRIEWPHTEGFG